MTPANEIGYFQIRLRGREDDYPPLLDVSSFLYDFNLIYEFSRLGSDPKYSLYSFSQFSWNRNARRLANDDRLRVVSLRHESPLALIVVVAAVPSAVGAIWGVIQIVEKMANWPLNREILKLQRDKLRKDLAPSIGLSSEFDDTFRQQLQVRGATHYYDRTGQRLESSPVKITEFDVTIIRSLPPKPQGFEEPPAP
jgi:hypothetical protein